MPSGDAPRVELRRNPEWRLTLLRRVREEFVEMPGMHLTLAQAQRLFGLRADICERILRGLVEESFLTVDRRGAFVRRSAG
jgi:hypothetical protein